MTTKTLRKDNLSRKSALATIREMGRFINAKFPAKEVILFGSYANGSSTKESDVDILIIIDTQMKGYKKAAQILGAVDDKFGTLFSMDILVRTPRQIERAIADGDDFIKDIITHGTPL